MDLQPGVASVYCTIVQQSLEDVEFYIRNFPQFCGKSYAAVRRSFQQVVVCGYVRPKADQPLCLNPPDSEVLHKGDLIVCLAQTGNLPFFCSLSLMGSLKDTALSMLSMLLPFPFCPGDILSVN